MPTAPKWIGNVMERLASRSMQVERTCYINTHILKIGFKGDLSGMDFQLGYAIAMRVSDTDFRNYTPSFVDVKKGILEIIFHLHSNGSVGRRYIEKLKAGNQVRLSIPRGQKQYNPKIKKQLIFGDETSLGLMMDFLSVLKKNKHHYQFYIELDEDNTNIPEILDLDNHIVFSKNDVFRNKEKIRELPIIKNEEWKNANIILTGNVTSLQNFRKVLKEHNHKGKIYVKGFWLEGKKGL